MYNKLILVLKFYKLDFYNLYLLFKNKDLDKYTSESDKKCLLFVLKNIKYFYFQDDYVFCTDILLKKYNISETKSMPGEAFFKYNILTDNFE